MERKYELTNETIMHNGRVLYRIKALKSLYAVTRYNPYEGEYGFYVVHKGDLGGFVESEDNLSHEGHCWVFHNAKVYDNARISENAQVSYGAEVFGKTQVSGDVCIGGKINEDEYDPYANGGEGFPHKDYHNSVYDADVKINLDLVIHSYGDVVIYNKESLDKYCENIKTTTKGSH